MSISSTNSGNILHCFLDRTLFANTALCVTLCFYYHTTALSTRKNWKLPRAQARNNWTVRVMCNGKVEQHMCECNQLNQNCAIDGRILGEKENKAKHFQVCLLIAIAKHTNRERERRWREEKFSAGKINLFVFSMCRAAQFIRWNALQLQSAKSSFALVILMACDWYEAFWTRTH